MNAAGERTVVTPEASRFEAARLVGALLLLLVIALLSLMCVMRDYSYLRDASRDTVVVCHAHSKQP